jgi:signal transduction histidine kinase
VTRLYLRIFLSFWLVIVLTIAVVLALNFQLERAWQDDAEISQRAVRMASNLGDQARHALERNGEAGLRRFAERSNQRRSRLQVLVFDAAGNELTGRSSPRAVRQVVRHWQSEGDIPGPRSRGQYLVTLASPDHGQYLLVLSPPRRPLVLRLLGPLGPWGLLVLAMVFSGLVCLWLARTITRPVREIRSAGQQLGHGRLDARVPGRSASRGDELGDLARDFNRMADRLERLVGAQQQLLRDVSHELRSPLARLQVSLALADASPDAESRRTHLERIGLETETLDKLIGEILGYVRLSEDFEPDLERIDLVDLIADIAESARLEGQPRHIKVEVAAPDTLEWMADADLLHRAIENIVRNALRHSPQRGRILLELSTPDPDRARLIVADQGPGVPESRLEDIFHPFVRLSGERSEAGIGGGVGLAIARAAIERHDGTIRAANRVEGGLEIRIELPRRNTSQQNASGRHPRSQ